jgi:hypothetical protein
MIGIQRTEIDRSQVLRPISGEYFGMVLQVPYGPLDPTPIASEVDLMNYFTTEGKPNPLYKDYYEAIVLLKQTPLLACRPQGDALFGGVEVENGALTANTAVPLATGATSIGTFTFTSDDVQFAIFATNPSADNNNYSIEIEATSSEVANTFDLKLYYNSSLLETFNVSLVVGQKDGFGNSVYIEDVIKDRYDIQVVVNPEADLTILPAVVSTEVAFGGGVTITDFSDTSDTIAAWNKFQSYNENYTHYLVDCSCNYTIGKAVIDIAEANWYQHPFLGIPSIKSTNKKSTEVLNTWKTKALNYRDVNGTELNVNNDHGSLYGVWGEVSDNYNNTTVWISPVSTAAARRAYTNRNIGFSQAACGLNLNRGVSNDFIRLEQDVSTIVDDLEAKQINVLTFTPGGKAIWNERTLQTAYTNTSFQSHRILFNTLEENIENLLVTFVFTDNNEGTRSNLTSLVDDYLRPMKGVHLDDYLVKCDTDNNPATLIAQRKMKIQVAVIPYPKANQIVFEFIHTRTGVSLEELV